MYEVPDRLPAVLDDPAMKIAAARLGKYSV
jgi:hypothetical protein